MGRIRNLAGKRRHCPWASFELPDAGRTLLWHQLPAVVESGEEPRCRTHSVPMPCVWDRLSEAEEVQHRLHSAQTSSIFPTPSSRASAQRSLDLWQFSACSSPRCGWHLGDLQEVILCSSDSLTAKYQFPGSTSRGDRKCQLFSFFRLEMCELILPRF